VQHALKLLTFGAKFASKKYLAVFCMQTVIELPCRFCATLHLMTPDHQVYINYQVAEKRHGSSITIFTQSFYCRVNAKYTFAMLVAALYWCVCKKNSSQSFADIFIKGTS